MLHLSFTQQLCHVAKIKHGEAANDAIFGLSADKNDGKATLIKDDPAQEQRRPTPYLALRLLAQRCLTNKI